MLAPVVTPAGICSGIIVLPGHHSCQSSGRRVKHIHPHPTASLWSTHCKHSAQSKSMPLCAGQQDSYSNQFKSAAQRTVAFRLTHATAIDPEGWRADRCLVLPNWLCLCKHLVHTSVLISHCWMSSQCGQHDNISSFKPQPPPSASFLMIFLSVLNTGRRSFFWFQINQSVGITGGASETNISQFASFLSIMKTIIAKDPPSKWSQGSALNVQQLQALLAFMDYCSLFWSY